MARYSSEYPEPPSTKRYHAQGWSHTSFEGLGFWLHNGEPSGFEWKCGCTVEFFSSISGLPVNQELNPSTGLIWGGPAPPPARIRNGGRQIKRMIGVPGIQLKKNRNAFPRHRSSWTSTN